MRRIGNRLLFSPSDLVNYLRSDFITWMDRNRLEGCPEEPDPDADSDRLIHEKGLEHEARFVDQLRAGGQRITEIERSETAAIETLRAMQRGEPVIYQGYLEYGEFAGYPDFLVRIETPSRDWPWSYEVWDTKLAHHPKPYYLIQLCCYAELLEAAQGFRPRTVRVVLGKRENGDLLQPEFRTDDFFFYYRAVKAAFLEQQRTFHPDTPPEIPALVNLGRWSGYAERLLEERDDLSLVANIRRSQIRKLREAGITTVAQLAAADQGRIAKLNDATLDRLRRQARLQICSRERERPLYERLPPDGDACRRGLALLPPSDAADIFFDMEGYPLVDEGREYLFGACTVDKGRMVFKDWWAHSPVQEKQAFTAFVQWAHRRWRAHPGLHIYHYNHYEVDALRRLMGRYGVCEHEVDELLTNEVFTDLYTVVRQALLIGEPSYSLKYVEHLYRGRRVGDVASADDSMVAYQNWLVAQDGDSPQTSAILRGIRDYNEQDCRSTAELGEWLRARQHEAGIAWVPKPAAKEREESAMDLRQKLAAEILAEIPDVLPPGEEGERWRVASLLAHLLEFHRREEKIIWWHRFDRQTMEEKELVDDPDCLGGLQRTAKAPVADKQSLLYEYRFDPQQETKVREDDTVLLAHNQQSATLWRLDQDAGVAVLRIGKKQTPAPDRCSIYRDEPLLGKLIAPAIERLVRAWRGTGHLPPALSDLLYRRRPRLAGNENGPIAAGEDDSVAAVTAAAGGMRETTLCVQGPPGCGKTFTTARAIAALLREGRRVGVTSNGHRAINLLLAEVLKVCEEQGCRPVVVKGSAKEDDGEGLPEWVPQCPNGNIFDGHPTLVGATAFALANEAAEGRLDYLFVDEAGQVSVANVVAMCAATRNLVLIGDQMQLGQPMRGSHPGESGQSALEYLLQDQATIPEDFGIFLPRTWRMHPEICRFISGAVYEDRLQPEAHTAERVLVRDGHRQPDWLNCAAGLVYLPVEHEGNTYESSEEEDRIAAIVRNLVGLSIRETGGRQVPLRREDILVVAPYNLQVNRLSRRLAGVRVGTVDKFQGQEAPVVIFSMCASSGDSSSRGIEFLFNRNRLNVAISRAQTLVVLVANPALVRTSCSTIEQMRLVNMYCRAVREAERAAAAAG